jgi:hypothetical protein
MSSNTCLFYYLFLKPHQTTYHSNIGVLIRKIIANVSSTSSIKLISEYVVAHFRTKKHTKTSLWNWVTNGIGYFHLRDAPRWFRDIRTMMEDIDF